MPGNHSDLERRLWAAADELRANSSLSAAEYSTPVLGLIFLKYADYRFTQAERELAGSSRGRRSLGKADYQARGVLWLPDTARFSRLANLPEGENLGRAVNDAMKAIGLENPDLKGILPKSYTRLENSALVELVRIMQSIPDDIEGDAFGRIYEYFLGNFAMQEGRDGGEFFTPTPIVKLIVEVIEPFHGRVFDPACGSGGMFVQSARFVEEHRKRPSEEISVYGQEKTTETVRLCKMNLAVHGLSGDIREANSYYEDPHSCVGRFDFVMANPPFNVNRVDKERLAGDPRFPLGLPRADNANYLWIQLFHSALKDTGRAGFVMHNSAADAEVEIRRQLIESNAVDVVIITSPNLFYTVNLPCSLWFLDRHRANTERKGHVLFVDARHVFRQVSTAQREITDEQIAELASIVRSYRGEPGYGDYRDRAGLCKRVSVGEIRAKGFSLNPKLYVEPEGTSDWSASQAARLSESVSRLLDEADKLHGCLRKELSMDLPCDRGILVAGAKLLFRKWLLNLDSARAPFVGTAPQQGLPSGWKVMPIRELLLEYIGGAWGASDADDLNSELVTVVRGTDIDSFNHGELANCPQRFIKPPQLRKRQLRAGDLIIEVSGGGKVRSTGRSALVTRCDTSDLSPPLICASFCKTMRPDQGEVLPTILYLYLQYLFDQKLMGRYEIQSTGIKNFRFEYFLDNAMMAIPPRPVQVRFDATVSKMLELVHVLGMARERMLTLSQGIGPGGEVTCGIDGLGMAG